MEPGVYAHFETTEGSFTIRLFEKEAPLTVANFVGLAEGSKEWKDPVTGENKKAPFYDGVVFHRVINGFMIQGGRPARPGHRRTGVQVRRRIPPVAPTRPRRYPVDGQRGTELEWKPVLHHARADTSPGSASFSLRRSGRRARCRAEDRRRPHGPAGSTRFSHRDEQSQDRAGRVVPDGQQRGPELDALLPVVYEELRRLAAAYLRRERPGQTLQPTALVHEAYLRLMKDRPGRWQNRAHFCAIAAHSMRQILIERARARGALKRGGAQPRVTLDESIVAGESRSIDLVALDSALERLEQLDAEQARLVELRFFGGLTIEETAEAMGISPATVKRHWTVARAWLARELAES